MRTRILATTALLSLTTLAGLLNADIGPKPSKIGPGLAPTSDMPGINVEMTSEKVDLVLTRSKGDDEQLSVTADFNMTNLGDGATSFEIGFPIPPTQRAGTVGGYHCWAELYIDGSGWIPVDSSEASKHPEMSDYYYGNLDENRIYFSRGRDITLEPPQEAGPVNYLIYPYVEVDGGIHAGVEKSFAYRDLEMVGSGHH